jgi:diamine N-acetyltransferase
MTSDTFPDIHFERINARTVRDVCRLSETLSDEQRKVVADNAVSIAEAHFSENAWIRAIYADKDLIGFIMLHIGSDYDDGIDCDGVFLWRFMIARPYQKMGYGNAALEKLFRYLESTGVPVLYTSCRQGRGSPEVFYRKLGFSPTGDHYGDEIELILELGQSRIRR